MKSHGADFLQSHKKDGHRSYHVGRNVSFFKDDPNSIKKGELKFKSEYVLDLRINDFMITAKVRASMKDKSYNVNIAIDGSGGIKEATCQCPRGNWICSHMAAASIYVHKKGLSKTDLPNSWIARPKKAARTDVKPIADLFPYTRPTYKATSRQVELADKEFLFCKLVESPNSCPLTWIIGPEPPVAKEVHAFEPVVIEDILQDFISDKATFIEKCKVSSEQITWLADATKDQRKSCLWGKF